MKMPMPVERGPRLRGVGQVCGGAFSPGGTSSPGVPGALGRTLARAVRGSWPLASGTGTRSSVVIAPRPVRDRWPRPGTVAGRLGHRILQKVCHGRPGLAGGRPGWRSLRLLVARKPNETILAYTQQRLRWPLTSTARNVTGWNSLILVFGPGTSSVNARSHVIARASEALLYLCPGNRSGGWLRA
jgi:hypothetical protein